MKCASDIFNTPLLHPIFLSPFIYFGIFIFFHQRLFERQILFIHMGSVIILEKLHVLLLLLYSGILPFQLLVYIFP